jgi:hypothetical protein
LCDGLANTGFFLMEMALRVNCDDGDIKSKISEVSGIGSLFFLKRFPPWLVVFVKLQPLLHQSGIITLAGGCGKLDGLLLELLRLVKAPGFRASHGQCVHSDRLCMTE